MKRGLILLTLLAVTFSCGKPEEVIPGRVEPEKPDPKPEESEYADPGVEPLQGRPAV